MTETQTEVYRKALAEAKAAYTTATDRVRHIDWEKANLEMEIAKLKRTITALAALCSEAPWSDALGITESCAEVMNVARAEMTTTDVVDALERIGFDLSSQKNANASVHAVLTRLAKKGTITKAEEAEGEPVRWRGPIYDPNYDPDDIPF